MGEFDQGKIAHLQMVQGVITRMETNCFSLKALAVTFTAGALAYVGAADEPSPLITIAALVPIVLFWLLDAQYLRLGRLFRHLYNGVRKGEVKEPFSMNFSRYGQAEQGTLRIAFSWSVLGFYSPISGILILLFFYLKYWE